MKSVKEIKQKLNLFFLNNPQLPAISEKVIYEYADAIHGLLTTSYIKWPEERRIAQERLRAVKENMIQLARESLDDGIEVSRLARYLDDTMNAAQDGSL